MGLGDHPNYVGADERDMGPPRETVVVGVVTVDGRLIMHLLDEGMQEEARTSRVKIRTARISRKLWDAYARHTEEAVVWQGRLSRIKEGSR